MRPSRSRSEDLAKRAKPYALSSRASRAATSAILSSRMVTIDPPLSSRSVQAQAGGRAGASGSDVEGLQRLEAVESHGSVGCGIGASALDQHPIANFEADREHVGLLLVQHVGRVAGRLGEPAELADIEIDPAHIVFFALFGDEDDFRLDHAGIPDHAAAGFDDGLRDAVTEMLAQGLEDRRAVGLNRRDVLQIFGRKPATEIDHGELDTPLATFPEHGCRRSERPVPGMLVALL